MKTQEIMRITDGEYEHHIQFLIPQKLPAFFKSTFDKTSLSLNISGHKSCAIYQTKGVKSKLLIKISIGNNLILLIKQHRIELSY